MKVLARTIYPLFNPVFEFRVNRKSKLKLLKLTTRREYHQQMFNTISRDPAKRLIRKTLPGDK